MVSLQLARPRIRDRVRRVAPLSPLQVVPAAVVLAIGIVELARNIPLWYDEEYTQLAAGVPLQTLAAGVWNRVGVIHYLMDVPPSFNAPYYAVMHGWVLLFGSSPFSLRLPSVICSAIAVGVLSEVGRRMGGRVAGWATGLLVATGALFLDVATQARPYGMALLCLALCALWFDRWRSTGRGVFRIAAIGASAGLLQWFALPVVAGFAVVALVRGRRGVRMGAALLLAGVPAAALVVWSAVDGAPGAPNPPVVGWALPAQTLVDWTGGLTALAVLIAVVAVIGIVRSRDPMLITWTVLPLVLITALELARPSYFPRYLLFTMAGVLVAAGVGLAALASIVRPWGRRVAVLVLAVAVAASLYGSLPVLTKTVREPGPAAVAYLGAHQVAGQPIIPADGRTSLDLETYLDIAPRIESDLVLPPTLFTTRSTSRTVWLVRVVLHINSLPVVPAEQRLIDSGWTLAASHQLHGSSADLRIEKWTR